MRYIVKLTDGSETELDHMTWSAAVRQALAWHAEISRSAGWDNPDQAPFQVVSITRTDVTSEIIDPGYYTLVSSREFREETREAHPDLNWRDIDAEDRAGKPIKHADCNYEWSTIGWPQDMLCCHTHRVILPY